MQTIETLEGKSIAPLRQSNRFRFRKIAHVGKAHFSLSDWANRSGEGFIPKKRMPGETYKLHVSIWLRRCEFPAATFKGKGCFIECTASTFIRGRHLNST